MPPKKKALNKEIEASMIIEKLPGYFLLLCMAAVFFWLFRILEPFVMVIFIAAVLAVAFYPIYKGFSKLMKGYNRLASFFTCLVVVAVIVVPLIIFTIMLTQEALSTYDVIVEKVNSGVFDKYLQWQEGAFFYELKRQIDPIVDIGSLDIKDSIINFAQTTSTVLVSQATSLAKGLSEIMLSLVVMFFCLFYFFKDGESLVSRVGVLSPLPSIYESELFGKIKSMVEAVVFGVFLTAVVQGLVGGIGFAIVGVSSPVFWGTTTAIFSLVPVVGTAAVFIPASIILAILGSYGAALFIFLWGVFAVGSVDNLLRPMFIGGKAHTYSLMTFLVVLGGVVTLGLKGVVIGPLVLIILVSLLHIYEAEYKRVLKK
ncbi:hypothetical protein COU74_04370 [Candidatus Peregrinibacteria bacterium CG10_big_fil_rev_8_21_14_0_10_36_19]|nr:MAG: hypothetical protein COU74_04370 [Candidatus Peregrinibacteria bacterium CG10_big_fil_rev_8_21_14_0_10_36_19]